MKVTNSLYNEPEKWRQTSATLKHVDGAEIWTSGGFIFINMHPAINLNWYSKFKLWRAYRWWSNNAPIDVFQKNMRMEAGEDNENI